MDPIQWLFTLFAKHVPVPPAQFSVLEKEARTWYETKAADTKVGATVKQYGETWYIKTALAVLFIFASRWLFDFMNPQLDEDEEDD